MFATYQRCCDVNVNDGIRKVVILEQFELPEVVVVVVVVVVVLVD